MAGPGLIVAAPASGSGKTVFVLGLLRALRRMGVDVAAAKVGPDYIDPAFHAAASGRDGVSLDGWAMRPATLAALVARVSAAETVVCEGVMGLFDGAAVPPGAPDGSTADIARATGWPVVLVMDVSRQAASAAAAVEGFRRFRPDVAPVALVFNRVGGPGHRALLEEAFARHHPDLPVLGWIPHEAALRFPERHLGLVQAGETADLDARLEEAAAVVARHVDIEALRALARPSPLASLPAGASPWTPDPPGSRIAVARDDAFAFAYPWLLDGWRRAGAHIEFFAPLADEAPSADADVVYLPGGYPELHAGRLAAASRFLAGLHRAAAGGAWVWGECGGGMVLGEAIEDADGVRHPMAGLLPLATSFRQRRLHLGYRRARLCADTPLGPVGTWVRGHEFHYATVLREGPGQPLFDAADAGGRPLGPMGRIAGRVMGSFLHAIDRDEG